MNVFRCNNCLLTNGVRFTHLRDSSFNVSIGRHIFLANLCQEMSEKSLPFIFVIFLPRHVCTLEVGYALKFCWAIHCFMQSPELTSVTFPWQLYNRTHPISQHSLL